MIVRHKKKTSLEEIIKLLKQNGEEKIVEQIEKAVSKTQKVEKVDLSNLPREFEFSIPRDVDCSIFKEVEGQKTINFNIFPGDVFINPNIFEPVILPKEIWDLIDETEIEIHDKKKK